ncbi:hypothetical protein Droror1_Dr00009964 [Drosera rotundifolia]
MAEAEAEYESDPEEAKLSLKMRRKVASDDEEELGSDVERERKRGGIDSDAESDGQGGAAEYDDEGLGEEEEEIDEVEEEEEVYDDEEEVEEEEEEGVWAYDGVEGGIRGGGGGEVDDDALSQGEGVEKEGEGVLDQTEEEKKEKEPFAVPTAGAFYMHDDRFRASTGGGRNRRAFGRRLWESKDEKKWGHDKFEEIDVQERHFEEGRKSSRGYNRGRGRGRATDRGYGRGNKPRRYDGNNNQAPVPMIVRGRGPRRYQPLKNRTEAPFTQNKQSVKSHDRIPNAASGRNSMSTATKETETVPVKKVASSLNSASPPFYPSGSSNNDASSAQRRETQAGISNRNIRPTVGRDGFSMQQPTLGRGKNVIDGVGMDKLYIDNSVSAMPKMTNNVHMPRSSTVVPPNQTSHSRGHGRGTPLSGSTFQPNPSHTHANKLSSPSQVLHPVRHPVQSRNHPSLPVSSPQLGQRPIDSSQSSPPKSGVSVSAVGIGELDSGLELNKSEVALVGKGKGILQGGGRGPFLYGGAQAMMPGGNVGVAHGDQNFPAAPTFLPVMQFGGQHPGGLGVPAVGMAFPGYVGNPQLGLGNSEMTWLPVLAGAAGALGTTYPYITVDGAYHSRPPGQTSLIATSSKENGSKPGNEWKPQQRSEISSDDSSQRQNKPRRYSEMKFDE